MPQPEFKRLVGRRVDSKLVGRWISWGWGASAGLDCMGGQLVLLTRDQYCPQSGWSQAAGSDRGAVWRNWIRGRSKSPPQVLSQLSHVIPLHCCHPRRPVVLPLPFPSHPCKCPLRRRMLQILGPFFMLLCKGRIYVIWEFHGNKVAIYWKLKEWKHLERKSKWLGSAY